MDSTKRESVLPRLQAIEIWSAAKILYKRHIKMNSVNVYGIDEPGDLVHEESGGIPRFYFSAEDIARGSVLSSLPLCARLRELANASPRDEVLILQILSGPEPAIIEQNLRSQGYLVEEFAAPPQSRIGEPEVAAYVGVATHGRSDAAIKMEHETPVNAALKTQIDMSVPTPTSPSNNTLEMCTAVDDTTTIEDGISASDCASDVNCRKDPAIWSD